MMDETVSLVVILEFKGDEYVEIYIHYMCVISKVDFWNNEVIGRGPLQAHV